MDILVIGSNALHKHYPERDMGKDIDIVGSYEDIHTFIKSLSGITQSYPLSSKKWFAVKKHSDGSGETIIEANIAWNNSTDRILLDIVKEDPETIREDCMLCPSIDVLYALKMSHRYLRNSPHFVKTHDDIMLLRSLGAKISDRYHDWFVEREKQTYNYGHPKLNVAKKDFFKDDAIVYVYDHDSIHEAMKHLERPAYTYFKPEGNEVMCSEAMFFSLPDETKLYAVLEEVYVLALERSQLAFPILNIAPRKSFNMALIKVCSSITSGWFREFSWENYRKIQDMYDEKYVEKFNIALSAGVVKLHGEV